jgi:CRP/FNR family transcriptional regulator, anaerobic regulatory protein
MEAHLPDMSHGQNGRAAGRPLINPIAALCADCRPANRQSPRTNGGRISRPDIKQQHIVIPPGMDIVTEGERSRGVYVVCDGWAVRYNRLGPATRQILDVLLPGDTFALAATISGTSQHSVQAITSVSVCLLNGRQIVSLLKTDAAFAFGVLQVREADERRADARLTMLGRLSAGEKLGYFMVEIYDRLQRRGMANGKGCPFPLRRNDVADALGLSKVHISRALRALRAQALVDIRGQDMFIPDVAKLADHAGYAMD